MRVSSLLLPVVIALALGSCKKNNEKTTSFTGDPTDYILKKVAYTSTNGQLEFIYTYNNDHLVTHVDRFLMNTVEPPPANTDTQSADFVYTAGRCTSMTIGSNQSVIAIEYDAQGKQIKSTHQVANYLRVHNYTYDAQQRLTGSTSAVVPVLNVVATVFTYNGSSMDPESVGSTYQNGGAAGEDKIEWTTNTNGDVNYVSAIRGLPMEWLTQCNSMWYIGSFAHNVAIQKEYFTPQPGQPLVLQSTTTYSYSYNDAGLPVHIVQTNNGVVQNIDLEYEKYK